MKAATDNNIVLLQHPHQTQLDSHEETINQHRLIITSLVERITKQAKEIEQLEALVNNMYDIRNN